MKPLPPREPPKKVAVPNYSMLDDLKEVLGDIEQRNDWDHGFISDLIIKREEGTLGRLSDRQFENLLRCHQRYCVR